MLIDEACPDGLARAVLALHDDPDRAGRLASAARRRAVQTYTDTSTAERMSAVLTEAAARARGSR